MANQLLEMHDIDVTKFLELLESCQGNVWLITREGDRLNLKSKLCQLVGLTRLIEGGKLQKPSFSVRTKRMNRNCSGSICTKTFKQQGKRQGPQFRGGSPREGLRPFARFRPKKRSF